MHQPGRGVLKLQGLRHDFQKGSCAKRHLTVLAFPSRGGKMPPVVISVINSIIIKSRAPPPVTACGLSDPSASCDGQSDTPYLATSRGGLIRTDVTHLLDPFCPQEICIPGARKLAEGHGQLRKSTSAFQPRGAENSFRMGSEEST